MGRNLVGWILRHKDDSRVLCKDGRRRMLCFGVESIKMYKRVGNAMRKAGTQYSCHAVYDGDELDACGRIFEPSGWER